MGTRLWYRRLKSALRAPALPAELTRFCTHLTQGGSMTTKVVYNACYGGFGLSDEAIARLKELGSTINDTDLPWEFPRHDLLLVQVVEELGGKANARASKLRIAEVCGPYRIEEYDGLEAVYEPGDYDWITP